MVINQCDLITIKSATNKSIKSRWKIDYNYNIFLKPNPPIYGDRAYSLTSQCKLKVEDYEILNFNFNFFFFFFFSGVGSGITQLEEHLASSSSSSSFLLLQANCGLNEPG
jgi:hypothetical protein